MSRKPTATDLLWRAHVFFWNRGIHIQAFGLCALHSSFESDMLLMTKADRVHEVEIKVSKSDFKADFEKSAHMRLRDRYGTFKKHDLIKEGQLSNYFRFAVPAGMVNMDEVPEYAGLLEFEWNDYYERFVCRMTKKAPLLHKRPADPKLWRKMMEAMMHKAWKLTKDSLPYLKARPE